jgi:hypothetical protein
MQAASSAAQSRYAARVATRNAQMEDLAARDAIDRGKVEAQNYQRQAAQVQGAQRAAMAANGIDVDYGTAGLVRGDTARFQAEDVQNLRENAIREARGYEINAANYRSNATASRQAASSAITQGVFGVASTLLGGAQQYQKIKFARRS